MHRSQQARRRLPGSKSHFRNAALAGAIDVLESRPLFSGETVSTAISPVLANLTSPSANSITLDTHFTDANLPGTLATFKTNLGTITVALTDAATPMTVANFLYYINKGSYTNTIFHRAALLGSTSGPADIIQGGGYVLNGNTFTHIPTTTPVKDEYTTEIYNDSTGTLAMAKTSSANSATSEWYFNVHDNTSALDTPTTDSNGVTTSYTVFGKVLSGMNVVDEIAALPTYNVSSTLTTVPVTGLTTGEAKDNFPITANNLVYTDSITAQPGTDYTVTSDNNAMVAPKITNGVLSFTYASGLFGTARITVVAKNLDGTSASTSFAVTVPDTATPSAGPTAGNITAPNIVTGTSSTISVLGSAVDSTAAINPSSVTITAQPGHGTATVNSSTGVITYTPTAGFTGADTLTYTVADTAGTVSNTATVTFNVVAAPVSVTIGTASARTLTFTQPNGVVGHLTVNGGTALITFASNAVTKTTAGGAVTATGAGATIASIVITNTGGAAALTLTASGAVSLGSITDIGAVSIINAPNATVIGASSFKSIGRLILAGLSNSTLVLGSGSSTLIVPNVTDSSVSSTGSIASITSTQWLNDNGGYYTLTTPRLGRLKVTGGFAEVLNVTAAAGSLDLTTVGQASAAWTIAGTIGNATIGSPSAAWSLAAAGRVGNLTIGGNLTSNVSAGSIGSLRIAGTTTGATITSSTAAIGNLKLGGAVSTSTITSAGKIVSLTAAALSSTQITAGTIGSLIVAGTTTGTTVKTTAGTSSAVQIALVRFGGAVDTSSVTSSGKIASLTAASLSSSQVTGGTIGRIVSPGVANTATIRTTAAASAKVQIAELKLGATASSSISTAGSIGSLSMASLDSTQIAGANINSIAVSGTTNSATFTTSGVFSKNKLEIGRIIFGGAVTSTSVTSVGNVGSISAASITGSHIYVGVTSTVSQSLALPTTVSQFAADARIASVTLGKAATAFSNTIITAQTMGRLALGNIASANGGTPQGIVAHKISAITGTLVPGGKIDASGADLKSATTLAAYEKSQKLSLGDFVINLI